MASLIPGPAVFAAMKNALQFGFKTSLIGILGNATALLTLYFISTIGLGAIILASKNLFFVLKVVGGLYLIYLGLKLIFSKGDTVRLFQDSQRQSVKSRQVFMESYWVGMSNPKAIAFATALFPQFVDPNVMIVPQFLLLSLSSAGVSFIILLSYSALASILSYRLVVASFQRGFTRVSGGIFVAFGAILALGSRA